MQIYNSTTGNLVHDNSVVIGWSGNYRVCVYAMPETRSSFFTKCLLRTHRNSCRKQSQLIV